MKLTIWGQKNNYSASGEYEPGIDPTLEPCPFCGSPDITVWNTHSPYYTCRCTLCLVDGPSNFEVEGASARLRTKRQCKVVHEAAFELAIELWNQRS